MAWVILIGAGLLEIVWAAALKLGRLHTALAQRHRHRILFGELLRVCVCAKNLACRNSLRGLGWHRRGRSGDRRDRRVR